MAFSDRVTEESKRITTTGGVKAGIEAAFNTFHTSIIAEMDTYTSPDQEKQDAEDKMIDLLRDLDAQLQ